MIVINHGLLALMEGAGINGLLIHRPRAAELNGSYGPRGLHRAALGCRRITARSAGVSRC